MENKPFYDWIERVISETNSRRERKRRKNAQRFKEDNTTGVYLVKAEHAGEAWVKIGVWSGKRVSRLSTLQCGSPIPLVWVEDKETSSGKEARELEKAYHKKFKDLRTKGEWFKWDPKIKL